MRGLVFATLAILGLFVAGSRGVGGKDFTILSKRANITDEEMLEDIAEARTCADCQVSYSKLIIL